MKFWDIETGTAFLWGGREFVKIADSAAINTLTSERYYFAHDVEVTPTKENTWNF